MVTMFNLFQFIQRTLIIAVLLVTGTGQAYAEAPINTLEKALFGYKPSGIAIRGYDPVAYFTEGKPVEGVSEYATEWMGATWLFASPEHLNNFLEQPQSYAPQYGGYCAYGVSQSYLVKVDPEQWTIVDDKLYLNYDEAVQKKWQKDIPGFIAKGDKAIAGLLDKE